MKTSTLIIFFTLIILKTQAQQQDGYYINFAGEGDTTGLGAVQVINMTNRDTVNLSGDDILHLNTTLLGVKIHEVNKRAMQVYPNPMTDQSMVTFVATENGEAIIRIVDVSGKTVYQVTRFLSPGNHSYRISGIGIGMYIVQVAGKNYSYSTKLVSQSNTESHARIEYSDNNNRADQLKSTAGIVEMKYAYGDNLLFHGMTGDYKRLNIDIPTSSFKMIFKFVNCRDADGNNYETVKIGNQTWMAENLRTTHFNKGWEIYNLKGDEWTPWCMYPNSAMCWYDNNEYLYKIPYGGLYNYYATVDPAGICPRNFHIPNNFEWEDLANTLGYPAIAGGGMKTPGTYEAGSSLWFSPNTAATNISGFSGIPGGYRTCGGGKPGGFVKVGEEGHWWGEYGDTFSLTSQSRALQKIGFNREEGASVRCVRDY